MKSAVTRANVHEAGARVQTATMNWQAHSSTAKLPNITRSIAKSPEIRGFFLGCGTRIRTQTNRVRVCRATITQFRNILL